MGSSHYFDDTSGWISVASGSERESLLARSPPCLYLNSRGANAVRFLRHTIQVCAPGVSTSVNCTFLSFSQFLNLRLILISSSSVPQAIHNVFSLLLIVASTPGNWVT